MQPKKQYFFLCTFAVLLLYLFLFSFSPRKRNQGPRDEALTTTQPRKKSSIINIEKETNPQLTEINYKLDQSEKTENVLHPQKTNPAKELSNIEKVPTADALAALDRIETWVRLENSTTENIKSLLNILIDFKYSTDNDIDISERETLKKRLSEFNFPIKFYVYPLTKEGQAMFDKTVDHCNRDVFIKSSFFPHMMIDCNIIRLFGLSSKIAHPLLQRVDVIEKADIAYIPFPLGIDSFLNGAYDERGFVALTHKINYDFLHELEFGNMPRNLLNTSIPHFVTYSYVSYRVSFHRIPKEVVLLTYEQVSVTGSPQDAYYTNGCFDRCLTTPYITIFDWPTYTMASPHTFNHIDSWKNRPYMISFVGSVDRTHILITHRMNIVSKMSAFKDDFHVFKESWATTSNIEIYNNSRFCLQLHGDTPTRNAFFESLLMGCIPIITEKSYLAYSALYGYMLPIDKITVVISNKHMEYAGVGEVMERIRIIESSGEYVKILKIIRSLSRLLTYAGEESNLLTMFTLIATKANLSIPNKVKQKGRENMFLGRRKTPVYKWFNFKFKSYKKEFSIETCRLSNTAIYVPLDYKNYTPSEQFSSQFEYKLLEKLSKKNILTDKIEDASAIFYPINLNFTLALENQQKLSGFKKKGIVITSFETDYDDDSIVRKVDTIEKSFNGSLVLSFVNHISPKNDIIKPIPYTSFADYTPIVPTYVSKYTNRPHLICYLDVAIGLPIPIFEMTLKSFMLVKLTNPAHLADCEYVLLPYSNPSRIIYYAVVYGTVPVTFKSKGLNVLPLSNFSDIAIRVPRSIKKLHRTTYELFSLWFIRFVQSIPFEEAQRRRLSLQNARKYFNLSPNPAVEDISSVILCSLEKFNENKLE